MRFIVFFALLTALNYYIFSFFARTGVFRQYKLRMGLRAVFFVFFAAQLFAPLYSIAMRTGHFDQLLLAAPYLTQTSYFALGVFSVLLFYVLIAELVALVLRLVPRLRQPFMRQRIMRVLLVVVVLATGVNITIGLQNSMKTEVEVVEIAIRDLPEAFDGVRIVQLSDIHIGPYIRRAFVSEAVQKIQPLKPDMVILTGDFADARTVDREGDAAPLGDLAPPLGKYYVTGNHEYYWDVAGWTKVAERLGFRALTNDHVIIEKDGAAIALAGVPDPTALRIGGTPSPDVARAVEGVPENLVKLLIAHQPVHQDEAQAVAIAAYFCGHTHGGQYFPYTFLFAPFLPAKTGLQDVDGMKLYVNRGTGFWGPPFRTNGKGEITLIKLKKE